MNTSVPPGWHPLVQPRVLSRTLRAAASGETYRVLLWQPDVEAPPGGFPVVYVLDADALFAGFVELVQRAGRRVQATGIGPVILVGVAHQGSLENLRQARFRDFTPGPARDEPQALPCGGAGDFLAFLASELIPTIEAGLPVDAARRALFGHSLAGYFCLWTLTQATSPFAHGIAVSPSIWWDAPLLHDALRGGVRPSPTRSGDVRLYLSAGQWEEDAAPWQRALAADPQWVARRARRRMLANTRELFARLQGVLPAGAACFEVLAGEDHLSVVQPSIARALRFLHGAE